MMNFSLFHNLPMPVIGLTILCLMLVGLEVGYRNGVKRHRAEGNNEAGGGTVALSSMFALLGLVLAFTYNAGTHRYDDRKDMVVEEAAVLQTAFLSAALIPDDGGFELQTAIYNYALTRLPGAKSNEEDRLAALNETIAAQALLWPTLEEALKKEGAAPFARANVAAIQQVLKTHTSRLAAIVDKLPGAVLWMLIMVSILTISVSGFNAGLTGTISRGRSSILALVITTVIYIIIDFDRGGHGFIQINTQSLEIVIAEMEAALKLP
jgi:hypothetical protein